MSEETNKNNAHDEHHDHSFPNWVTFGHTDDPVDGFIKIFAWLVFWTILEVLAIVQEFDSFALNMLILFGIALIKCWYILFILYAHDLGPTTCLPDCRSTTLFPSCFIFSCRVNYSRRS